MLTPMRALIVAVVTVAAAAQSLSLGGPSLAGRDSITVRINDMPRPDPKTYTDKAKWVVVVRSPSNPAGVQVEISGVAPTSVFADSGLIRITFTAPVAADVDSADVISLVGKPTRVTWSPKKRGGSLGIFPVDKRDKADVYLYGAWISGPDVAPTYNVDLSIGAPLKDFTWGGTPFRPSLLATVKTAERRDVDPDSYSVVAKVGRIYPADLDDAGPYFDFQWDVARVEFSRKDSFSNWVTAPTLLLSHGLARKDKDNFVRAAINGEIFGSIEAGNNMQAKNLPDGYGAIFRLVPGLALYGSFPGAFGLGEVRWTTTYRARILTTKEPFTDVRDDDNPFPSLARGTRHEWKDQLDFKVTPLLSLAITHEFGSVPPAFKILDHRFMFGVTAMWSWKN